MTDKNEVLELAKKCGIRFVPHGLTGNPTYAAVVTENEFLAFAAAMEEKHQARIAMLMDALQLQYAGKCTCNGLDKNCPACNRKRLIDEAISATQQSADAFVARVKAEGQLDALEHAADYADEAHHGKISSSELRRIAEELRNQQPAEICPNCDSPMPAGCNGIFRYDGTACRLNAAQPAELRNQQPEQHTKCQPCTCDGRCDGLCLEQGKEGK